MKTCAGVATVFENIFINLPYASRFGGRGLLIALLAAFSSSYKKRSTA